MKTINQHILKSLLNARKQLSPEANDLITSFTLSKLHADGGFMDRSGNADPYYSVFGYTLCYVFGIDISYKKNLSFLKNWQTQNNVDFVHAISMLRCYYLLEIIFYSQKFKKAADLLNKSAFIQNFAGYQFARKIRKQHKELLLLLTKYEAKDGGFNHLEQGAEYCSIYANFLAYSLFEDFQFGKLWRRQIANSCQNLQLENGSFVNHPKSKQGIGSTSAAGLILQNKYLISVKKSADWLKTLISQNGGFLAGEEVPVSDVLSTATSLLALNIVNESSTIINANAIEFANLHWDSSGGFFGSIADQIPDVEYTFYGLLTIGQYR
ncbi:MAG: hypothetical protein PF517_18360 [Salinivirgaceae bacterium]|jgi:hypothetical protein|nr:hypothetical protein [Salinivirgaceae bacterium]